MAKSYLNFYEEKDSGKTKVWLIENAQSGTPLGKIGWYGPWRRYVFFPFHDLLFDTNCLKEISGFIDAEMEKRK